MKRFLSILLVTFMTLTLVACGGKDNSNNGVTSNESSNSGKEEGKDGEFKFAVLFGTGGLGDNGYNDEVFEGCKLASEEFGVPFDYVEPKNIADFETQLRMYADAEEYDVIIAISTEQVDALKMVAEEYPDQKFCMLDAEINDFENIHAITASHPEQHFLSGMLAGLATIDDRFPKSNSENILGFTVAMDNPVSRGQASGFLAGAKYVNPDVEIIVNYIGSYADPGKGKELAMAMYDRGADIVSQNAGSSGLGVFAAAKERDKYVIGTSLGMVDPDHSLSTSRKKVEQFIVEEIRAIVEGTWKSGTTVMGIAEGVCDIDIENLNTEIPQDIIDKLNIAKERISKGELKMPNDIPEVDEWAKNNKFE